jgi:metal-dependent amidase/aminoacylase/carboxypeptidase family protein
MKHILLLFLTTLSFTTFAQNGKAQAFIDLETDKIFDKLVRLRRDFHKHPELAGNEKRTQELIQRYLLDLGMEVQADIYGHSVLGILKGGKPGKKIAWRADMDALSSDFPEEADYKSKIEGVQHGCGHDVHLAIGLGIAEVLSKTKESLAGTVYFIFQPEEENFRGAKGMIDHGLFDRIRPDEIYSLHVTALPTGKIMVKRNEMYAYQKRIRVKLTNTLTKEEVKALTVQIRSALLRSAENAKPWEIQRITDPEDGLSSPNTIFKDYLIMDQDFVTYAQNNELFLEAYLYETNQLNLEKIIPRIKQLIGAGKYKEKLLSVSFIQENPTVVNDPVLTKNAINILTGTYGKDLISPAYGQVPFFNDDFAYFQQKVPGVYFFLGGSNTEKGIVAMNHAPHFNVDETCIKIAVRSFSSLLNTRLK